jgi:hypothetical protein
MNTMSMKPRLAAVVALLLVAGCSSKGKNRESAPTVLHDADVKADAESSDSALATILWTEVLPSTRDGFIGAMLADDGSVALAATVRLFPGESLSFGGHQIAYAGEPPESSLTTVFALRGPDKMEWLRIAESDGDFEPIRNAPGDIVVRVLGYPSKFRWTTGEEWHQAVAPGVPAIRLGAERARDRAYALPEAAVSRRPYLSSLWSASDDLLQGLLWVDHELRMWDGRRVAWRLPLRSESRFSKLLRVSRVGDEIVACYEVGGASFQLGKQAPIPVVNASDRLHPVVVWISADKGRVLHTLDLFGLVATDDGCNLAAVRSGLVLLEEDDTKNPRWVRTVSRDGQLGPRLLELTGHALPVPTLETDGDEQVVVVDKDEDERLRVTVIDTARGAIRWTDRLPYSTEFYATSLRGDVLALTGVRSDAIEFLGARVPEPTTGDAGFAIAVKLPPR